MIGFQHRLSDREQTYGILTSIVLNTVTGFYARLPRQSDFRYSASFFCVRQENLTTHEQSLIVQFGHLGFM